MLPDAELHMMQQLEQTLLQTDFRQDPQQLDDLLTDDFREVSPVGTRANRAEVMQWLLQKDPAQRWQLSQWQLDEPAAGVRVLRYHAVRTVPVSTSKGALHVSIWHWHSGLGHWQLWFHQSTKVL